PPPSRRGRRAGGLARPVVRGLAAGLDRGGLPGAARRRGPTRPAAGHRLAPSAAGPAPPATAAATRLYLGSDGVKVPLLTDAEQQARQQKVKQKRRRCGKKCRPLPKAKPGADQRYKEFKIVTYYDEAQEYRHVSVTQGDHQAAGALMWPDACRLRLDK